MKPSTTEDVQRTAFDHACVSSVLFRGEHKPLEFIEASRNHKAIQPLFERFEASLDDDFFSQKKQALSVNTETLCKFTPFLDMEAHVWKPLVQKYRKHNTCRYMKQMHTPRWSTACARDYKDACSTRPIKPHPKIKNRETRTLPNQILHHEGYTGVVNPRWVETMMGLPQGWVLTYVQASKQDA